MLCCSVETGNLLRFGGKMMKRFMVVAVAFVALPAIASAAGVSGQWDFNSGDLTATVGSDMTYVALSDPGDNVSYGTDTIGGETASVLNFNFTELYDRAGYFATPHGIGANGGGARVNDFTVIMDLKLAEVGGRSYFSLWQTDTLNDTDNDADMYYYNSDGTDAQFGIGTMGYTDGGEGPDLGTWSRLAFVADSAAGKMTVYQDGVALFSSDTGGDYLDLAAAGIDGRESLTPADDATAPWLNLFSNGKYPGYYSGAGSLNSLQIRDYAMSGEEVEALGGATAAGIPEPITLGLLGLGALMLRRRKR